MPTPLETINSLSAQIGASTTTCKMAGANYPYDSRPYTQALAENGCPAIHQWALGEWDEEIAAQALSLLQKAITNRSTPMLGAWIISVPVEGGRSLLTALDQHQKEALLHLVKIGRSSDDLAKLFVRWDDLSFAAAAPMEPAPPERNAERAPVGDRAYPTHGKRNSAAA